MVKLQLEAVALAAQGLHVGQGGVALGPDGDVFVLLPVHHHRTDRVLLVFAGRKEGIPVVHDDVDLVNIGGIEEGPLIFDGLRRGGQAQGTAEHREDREDEGDGNSGKTEFVHMLAG